MDLRCSVLVSHPTLGEVHKMSSDHVLRALASSADAYISTSLKQTNRIPATSLQPLRFGETVHDRMGCENTIS